MLFVFMGNLSILVTFLAIKIDSDEEDSHNFITVVLSGWQKVSFRSD